MNECDKKIVCFIDFLTGFIFREFSKGKVSSLKLKFFKAVVNSTVEIHNNATEI